METCRHLGNAWGHACAGALATAGTHRGSGTGSGVTLGLLLGCGHLTEVAFDCELYSKGNSYSKMSVPCTSPTLCLINYIFSLCTVATGRLRNPSFVSSAPCCTLLLCTLALPSAWPVVLTILAFLISCPALCGDNEGRDLSPFTRASPCPVLPPSLLASVIPPSSPLS